MARYASKFAPKNNTQKELVDALRAVRDEIEALKEQQAAIEAKLTSKVPEDEGKTFTGTDYKLVATHVESSRFSSKLAAKFLTIPQMNKCRTKLNYLRFSFVPKKEAEAEAEAE